MRIVCDEGISVRYGCSVENLLDVSQSLGVVVHDKLKVRGVWTSKKLVNLHGFDLQVVKVAEVRSGCDGLLWLEVPEHIHAILFHDSKEVGIIARPLHVPNIFPFQQQGALVICLVQHVPLRLNREDLEEAMNVDRRRGV